MTPYDLDGGPGPSEDVPEMLARVAAQEERDEWEERPHWRHQPSSAQPDLVAFLLARLAEDEAVAQTATGSKWSQRDRSDHYFFVASESLAVAAAERSEDRAHIARHDPARVLAEVEVKRQIVAMHHVDADRGHGLCIEDTYTHPCDTLRVLAAVYSDHLDYDEEWKP